jgi:hypothetical protein
MGKNLYAGYLPANLMVQFTADSQEEFVAKLNAFFEHMKGVLEGAYRLGSNAEIDRFMSAPIKPSISVSCFPFDEFGGEIPIAQVELLEENTDWDSLGKENA